MSGQQLSITICTEEDGFKIVDLTFNLGQLALHFL